jgi:coiled-coil domain-containing protein 22
MNDLIDIENYVQMNAKNNSNKASRFTHNEKLQFTEDSSAANVSISTTTTEEKREEEIKQLKNDLQTLENNYNELEKRNKQLNDDHSQLEARIREQIEKNTKLADSIKIKERTVNLMNDAPMNIIKLKEEINNHEKKMQNLEKQWETYKETSEKERQDLVNIILNRKNEMQQKINETKQLVQSIDDLNAELKMKESLIKELHEEYDNLPKDATTETNNRQFYTKRILEIVANIDKQKKEINKVLIETKMIQKEINQLTGKLERIFNETDELIFKVRLNHYYYC